VKAKILAILTAGVSAFAACGHSAEPTQQSLRPVLEKFLKEEGYLCLGKFDWPIEVGERDELLGTRDAVQMPVLEHLGIVSSEVLEKPEEGAVKSVTVTRYALTEAGRKFYRARDTMNVSADGKKIVHHGDFCAGKLSLDRIVGWDPPRTVGDDQQVTITYTYKIAAADWARKPEIQKVFPMVGRIIKGEGTMQLQQLFRLTKDGWVAVPP